MTRHPMLILLTVLLFVAAAGPCSAAADPDSLIYATPQLKPTDSTLAVKVGDAAPEFDLPAIDGSRVSLAQYKGKKHLVLSFIPAAWTPVCSGQWPGYNILQDIFDQHDAALVGVSVDNIPTLSAWVKHMGGLWFPVASDFWPHGGYAARLGLLRSDGTTERALLLIDKAGIIRYVDVHDINSRPDLGLLLQQLEKLGPAGE